MIDEPEIITVTSNPVHTEETVLKEKHPSTKSNIFGSKIGEVKEKLNNTSVNSKPFIANEKIPFRGLMSSLFEIPVIGNFD